jgi:hypothetical protein
MKALDLEWIVNNWEQAVPADRLAAAKEARKRFRSLMTQLEGIARGLTPLRGDPAARMVRMKELRAQGLSLEQAVATLREESEDMPRWQPPDWPERRREVLAALDMAVLGPSFWRQLYPALEPAWTDLEHRAADLHTQLRIDDKREGFTR